MSRPFAEEDRTSALGIGPFEKLCPRRLRQLPSGTSSQFGTTVDGDDRDRVLEPIDIRKVWRREDRDFTPWLSASEPLTRLLAECAIDLGSDYSSRTEVRVPG